MFTTHGRYALRVMLDLADHYGEGFIPLKDIAERQEISKKYLESIVHELVKSNLVKGLSGKGGGYVLLRSPDQYSIGEILEASEGFNVSVPCLKPNAEPCHRRENCRTLPMWFEFDQIAKSYFYGKKLSDLMTES